jgi:hypothetical protein
MYEVPQGFVLLVKPPSDATEARRDFVASFLQLGEVADLEALTFNLSLNFI